MVDYLPALHNFVSARIFQTDMAGWDRCYMIPGANAILPQDSEGMGGGGHYGLRQRACMDIGGFDDISLSDESTERA